MTVYQLPTSGQNTHYSQVVTLSEQRYTLVLRFNTRMGRWILDIADGIGTPIVQGIAMLALRNLASQYTTLAVPPGVLFCYNAKSPFVDPSLASFLTDTQFLYSDPSTP